ETEKVEVKVQNLSDSLTEVQDPLTLFSGFVAQTAADNELLLQSMADAGVSVDEYSAALTDMARIAVDTGMNFGQLRASQKDLTASQSAAVDRFWELNQAIWDASGASRDNRAEMDALDQTLYRIQGQAIASTEKMDNFAVVGLEG